MQDLLNTLFNETSSIGIVPEQDFHNHIINESILLDMVKNNPESLNKVYSEIGKYAARDNILAKESQLSNPMDKFHKDKGCFCSALLAIAKEKNDQDYELFIKAYLLTKAMMKNLKEKYSTEATARVEKCKTELENNSRIMNAVDSVNNAETCC